MQTFEFELHLLAQLPVERGHRFVEEEDLGTVDQGAGQGDALLLTAGELFGLAAGEVLHLHEFEDFTHPFRDLGLGHLRLFEAIGDVVGDIHVREEQIGLEHRVHRPFVGRQTHEVLAVQIDVADRGMLETGDHPQQGRLPASRGSEQ